MTFDVKLKIYFKIKSLHDLGFVIHLLRKFRIMVDCRFSSVARINLLVGIILWITVFVPSSPSLNVDYKIDSNLFFR